MFLGWFVIVTAFQGILIFFTVILCLVRIMAKYAHRTIKEVTIFDVSEQQILDQDSPAILLAYFDEITAYEQLQSLFQKDY